MKRISPNIKTILFNDNKYMEANIYFRYTVKGCLIDFLST
jgi:hypothetical protein